MTTRVAPFRLKPWFSERVWGKRDLRPWYSDTGTTELVGEAWLTGPIVTSGTGTKGWQPAGLLATMVVVPATSQPNDSALHALKEMPDSVAP